MVRVSIKAMDKNNVDEPFTIRRVYLGEPKPIDRVLRDIRGSLEVFKYIH